MNYKRTSIYVIARNEATWQSPNKTPVIAREVRPRQSVGLGARVMRLVRSFFPRNDSVLIDRNCCKLKIRNDRIYGNAL